MRLVGFGLVAVVAVVFGLLAVAGLGLTAVELDLDLVALEAAVDFATVLDRAVAGVDLVVDLAEEELREVFLVPEVADLVLLATEVFTSGVLRLTLLAGSSGIEFCGGWSFLAMMGISSDFSSCGEGDLPLLRHFEGLSAHAST